MIYRCAVEGRAANQAIVNVFHVTAAQGQESAIAAAWESACKSAYLQCLNDAYAISQIVVTNTSTAEQHTRAMTGSGAQTVGDMLPPQNAAVLSWKTGLAGRRYRGRSYIGPMTELDQDAGVWVSGTLDNLDSLADALLNNWAVSFSGNLVIYHKSTASETPVTSYVVRQTVYTQRRRTIGQGG